MTTTPPGEASDTLAELAARFWDDVLDADPVRATALGIRDRDAAMPDPSEAARASRTGRLKRLRTEVEKIPEDADLSEADRVTRSELLGALGRELDLLEAAPARYLVSPMSGIQVRLPRLPDLQPLRTGEEALDFRARVSASARTVDSFMTELRGGLSTGHVTSVRPLQRSSRQLGELLRRPTHEWSLVTHAAAVDDQAGRDVAACVDDELRPALARMLAFQLGELLPEARPDDRPGLIHLPGGGEDYRRMVRYYTSLDPDPVEVHRIGLEEVMRLQDVLIHLGSRTLGAKDLPSLKEALAADESLRYESEEEILAKARDAVARAEARTGDVTTLRPAGSCEVLPIPPLEAPDAPLAYYRAPALDGTRPGRYHVNTHEPSSKLAIDAEGVAFHEAVPGHHLQIGIAQELELPDFRRHMGPSAYMEGWALYTERLADELDLYTSDLDRLGMLGQDLWRASRLVLDTGLHALGWSRTEAIEWARKEALLPLPMIENEIDRFVVMPGQALGYKLGELELLGLRRGLEDALGEDFDLVGFHDRVLGNGAVGLDTLARLLAPPGA